VQTVIGACKKAGVSALVYTSSASVVYSGKDIVCGDESLPYVSSQPDAYVQSKAEAEKLVIEVI
jgi:nucleoside-diphosphate-sugar epimerase